MRLLWKTKLDNEPRQMHSLLEPLVIGRVNTKSGPKEMVIQAGVSDNVYALDAKTGELAVEAAFRKHLQGSRPARGPQRAVSGRHDGERDGRLRRGGPGKVHCLRGGVGRPVCTS